MRKILPDLTESEIKGEIMHRFAVVPQVMPKDQWLATRGDPRLLPPPDDPERKSPSTATPLDREPMGRRNRRRA
jgi:hypothetical protein